jgi:hypothetical protein
MHALGQVVADGFALVDPAGRYPGLASPRRPTRRSPCGCAPTRPPSDRDTRHPGDLLRRRADDRDGRALGGGGGPRLALALGYRPRRRRHRVPRSRQRPTSVRIVHACRIRQPSALDVRDRRPTIDVPTDQWAATSARIRRRSPVSSSPDRRARGQPGLYQYVMGITNTVTDESAELWDVLARSRRGRAAGPTVLFLSEPVRPVKLALVDPPLAPAAAVPVRAGAGQSLVWPAPPTAPAGRGRVRGHDRLRRLQGQWRSSTRAEAASSRRSSGLSRGRPARAILSCLGQPAAEVLHRGARRLPRSERRAVTSTARARPDPREARLAGARSCSSTRVRSAAGEVLAYAGWRSRS